MGPLSPYLNDPTPEGLVGLRTPQMHQLILSTCHKLCLARVRGQAPQLFHVALERRGDGSMETAHPDPFSPKPDARKKCWTSPSNTPPHHRESREEPFPSLLKEAATGQTPAPVCGSRQMLPIRASGRQVTLRVGA